MASVSGMKKMKWCRVTLVVSMSVGSGMEKSEETGGRRRRRWWRGREEIFHRI
jgi:hypothetical protein